MTMNVPGPAPWVDSFDKEPMPNLGPEWPAASRILDRLRMGGVLVAVAGVTAVGIPLQWVALKLNLPVRRQIPMLFHRAALALMGVRVTVKGAPVAERPLLFLSNHSTWLDICVLGSVVPLVFVAKSEVAGWPLIGLLAKLQRSVFVDRQRRAKTGAVNQEIAERLSQGDPVVLFAEGTSSDGNRVLPFRSALVGAVQDVMAAGSEARVQPLSVAYVKVQGVPMGRQHRPLAAWYGDLDLAPHLLEVLRQGAIDVTVTFGEAKALDGPLDRKAVTRLCEEEVKRLLQDSLTGRGGAT